MEFVKINFGSINYNGWEPLPLEDQVKKFDLLELTNEMFEWEIITDKTNRRELYGDEC